MTVLISDLMPDVRFNLGGRTDIDSQITKWLKEAYREIAMGYPLETLELSVQNDTVQGVDTYDYPSDARALKSLVLQNTNDTPIELKKKNIQVVRRYQSASQGVPAVWAPFGSQYIVRPTPDGSYTLYVDYWQKPIVDETSDTTIQQTQVLVPDDWFEIVVQSATQKGHLDLQEADKALAIRQVLNGDPHSANGWPGMIKERLTRNAAENVLSDYGMRPRMRRYTSGR